MGYCRKIRLDLVSCDRLFDQFDKLFREVGHLSQSFEFGGDPLGLFTGFFESRTELVDFDFREDGFEGWPSVEQDLHVVRILQILDERGFSQNRAKHAA